MVKLILELNPDIVHVHYLGYYGLLGLFSGAKCIVSTPWGSDIIEGKKSFLKRQILLRILNKTKLIICDAYHMRDELKKLNVPQNKINIIYFGVDTKKFVRKDRNLEILNKFNIIKN